MGKLSILKVSLASAAALALMASNVGVYAADIVGLITKTETNPFFVKMREGAEAKAKELGIELSHRRRQVSTATMTARWRPSRT